jgi:DNA-directed RNA polymerase subunit RPC12/RpoP
MDMTGLLVILGVFGVIVALGVGGFFIIRSRSKVDDSFYHFRCGKCKRRIRYQERQVGHKGRCSNCGSDVLFPPLSQAVD